MIYQWENTIALVSITDTQTAAPLTLTGEGLWVCLVSSGSVSAPPPETAPGVVRTVQAGMLLLGRAPLTLIPAGDCHLLAAQLTGSAAAQLLAGLPHQPFAARGETCPAAAELLTRMAAEQHSPSRAKSQLAFSLLCELAEADSAAPALPPLVAEAIRDMRENYAGLYGVEELSERLGVSKSHLVRTFTAAMGLPPGKYLTAVRIEAAKLLLLHREYSLEVIASLCGFSGANYLCRVFKKETGLSPAQWRTAERRAGAQDPNASRMEKELYM